MKTVEKKYFIILSGDGDFLKIVQDTMWRAVFGANNATLFNSYKEATDFLTEEAICSIWPHAKVESILVG